MSKRDFKKKEEVPVKINNDDVVKGINNYYQTVMDIIVDAVEEESDLIVLTDDESRDKELRVLSQKLNVFSKKVNAEKEKNLANPESAKPEWIVKIHDADEGITLAELCKIVPTKSKPEVVAESKEVPESEPEVSESKPETPKTEEPESTPEAMSKEIGFGEFLTDVYRKDAEKPVKVMVWPSPDKKFFACLGFDGMLLKDQTQAEWFFKQGAKVVWWTVEKTIKSWTPGKKQESIYQVTEKYCDFTL